MKLKLQHKLQQQQIQLQHSTNCYIYCNPQMCNPHFDAIFKNLKQETNAQIFLLLLFEQNQISVQNITFQNVNKKPQKTKLS